MLNVLEIGKPFKDSILFPLNRETAQMSIPALLLQGRWKTLWEVKSLKLRFFLEDIKMKGAFIYLFIHSFLRTGSQRKQKWGKGSGGGQVWSFGLLVIQSRLKRGGEGGRREWSKRPRERRKREGGREKEKREEDKGRGETERDRSREREGREKMQRRGENRRARERVKEQERKRKGE